MLLILCFIITELWVSDDNSNKFYAIYFVDQSNVKKFNK